MHVKLKIYFCHQVGKIIASRLFTRHVIAAKENLSLVTLFYEVTLLENTLQIVINFN